MAADYTITATLATIFLEKRTVGATVPFFRGTVTGTVTVTVPLSNGLRKMRIPLRGRGKSGGGRVVYGFHSPDYPGVPMLLFAKSAADDPTADERKRPVALSAVLQAPFGVEP